MSPKQESWLPTSTGNLGMMMQREFLQFHKLSQVCLWLIKVLSGDILDGPSVGLFRTQPISEVSNFLHLHCTAQLFLG